MWREMTLCLVGLADALEVRASELPGRLDGLGSPGGEEDPVEVARRQVGQPLRQFHGRGMGVRPEREVGEFGGLLRGGVGEFLSTVTDLHHEQPG